MGRKFVDTNIFIEIFSRVGKKSDKSKELIQSSENLFTNMLVVSEVEWVLRSFYEMNKNVVVKCVKNILTSKVEIENKKLLLSALNFYENNNVDWTDCLNMFLAKGEEINEVYSYDKGLNKFNWITRLEP